MNIRKWRQIPGIAPVNARLGLPIIFILLGLCQLVPEARLPLEFFVYIYILATARSSKWTKALLTQLPPGYRRLICGFIVIMVIGQMYDRQRKIYPFVSWTMYSNATATVERITRIKARLSDGRLVDLPLHPFPIYTLNSARALRRFSKRANDPDIKDPESARRNLADFQRAIVRQYENRHPGHIIRTLLIEEAFFNIDHFDKPENLQWKIVYESESFR